MGRRLFFTLVLVLLAGAMSGCERHGPVEVPVPTIPSFSTIQESVFNLNCALSGCHLGSSAPLGLDLSEGKAYNNLVNVPSGELPQLRRVAPGKPDSSYLVWKIEGRPGIQGQRMPRGRDPLPQEAISLIRRWIDAGAPQN